MKSDVHKRRLDTRDELFAHNLDVAAGTKKGETNSDEQHVIFAHELQSALRLTVGLFENLL
jgi:hypothetical protein